jgi:N-acetylmuramoyl-L-alanine amidase
MADYFQVTTPHQSPRKGEVVRMVVIHGDAGKSDAGTVSWIEAPESKVSYHYLVGRDGTVYQFVREDLKAWHAGDSAWPGCTVGKSVNAASIGVAFANDGTEEYRPPQYKAGAKLVADICKRHGVPLHMIRGHYEVSPGRKSDPWQHFSWADFYKLLGLFAGDKAI